MKKLTFPIVFSAILWSACSTSDTSEVNAPIVSDAKSQETSFRRTSVDTTGSKKVLPVCTLGFLEPDAVAVENKAQDRSLLDSFYASIQQPKQPFLIDNNVDTIIVGKKGTQVYIPAGCFKYSGPSNELVKKEICLELKECYDYSDMLAENLTTINDDCLLRSQGMICLDASVDGKELELREGYELPLNFNNKVDNNSYDLYYGAKDKEGNLNWRLDPLACTASPVVMLTSGNQENNEETFFDRYYTFKKEDKIALKNSSWATSVSFNERGQVIGSERSLYTEASHVSAIEKFNNVIDNYRFHVRNSNFPSWQHRFSFTCVSADSADILRSSMFSERMGSMLRVSNFINTKKTFYARSLGWLNCDNFFIIRPLAMTAAFIIEQIHERKVRNNSNCNVIIGLESGFDNTDVKLVFKHDKSIVPGFVSGNICIFKDLPRNKDFVVVVTKCSKECVYYAAKEGRSLDGKDIKINLAYNKYATREEVIAEYKKLDEQLE